jgi:ABC-type Na+ transport system ATPase subunit NatA
MREDEDRARTCPASFASESAARRTDQRLDLPTVRSLRDILRCLREARTSVVFSIHVLDEVRALCDRVVVISQGTVLAQGSPAELCTQTGAPY